MADHCRTLRAYADPYVLYAVIARRVGTGAGPPTRRALAGLRLDGDRARRGRAHRDRVVAVRAPGCRRGHRRGSDTSHATTAASRSGTRLEYRGPGTVRVPH